MVVTTGEPAGDAVDLIVACATRTLAEPGARIAFGHDWNLPPLASIAGEGLTSRLIVFAAGAVWRRVTAGTDHDFSHGESVGFAEPATGRYMIMDCFTEITEVGVDGTTFTGTNEKPLDAFSGTSVSTGDVLWPLRLLPGATEASPEGTETLRGTACRKFAVQVDTAMAAVASPVELHVPRGVSPEQKWARLLALTVWVDGQHVRQIWFRDRGAKDPMPGPAGTASKDHTLELWDFGPLADEPDWSRMPPRGWAASPKA
jgi:hypothetical protein